MKHFTKKIVKIFAVAQIFIFMSCQTQSVEETHSIKQTITSTSPLTTFVERVVMQKTNTDNFIDKSGCFTIKFPYTITVNSVDITLNTFGDYQLVLNNMNASSTDTDLVTIHFPITTVSFDYTEKIILDQIAFDKLIANCNSIDFGKINCLQISYPITINVYNSNQQIASSTAIASNQELYSFINSLQSDFYIAISYPINIIDTNGQNVVIANNNQLEDIIKDAIDNCVEVNPTPNPNPTPPPPPTPPDFVQIITNNSWKISYFYDDKERTSIYKGYSFVFNTNNTVVATKDGVIKSGTWSTAKELNKTRTFNIKFNLEPLSELDEGWKVFEFNTKKLRFRDNKEGVNETDYLYFEKID